nr:hypothetical protein [Chitinimonas koreensis]
MSPPIGFVAQADGGGEGAPQLGAADGGDRAVAVDHGVALRALEHVAAAFQHEAGAYRHHLLPHVGAGHLAGVGRVVVVGHAIALGRAVVAEHFAGAGRVVDAELPLQPQHVHRRAGAADQVLRRGVAAVFAGDLAVAAVVGQRDGLVGRRRCGGERAVGAVAHRGVGLEGQGQGLAAGGVLDRAGVQRGRQQLALAGVGAEVAGLADDALEEVHAETAFLGQFGLPRLQREGALGLEEDQRHDAQHDQADHHADQHLGQGEAALARFLDEMGHGAGNSTEKVAWLAPLSPLFQRVLSVQLIDTV